MTVGDLRTRIADGTLVEVVAVDGEQVCVVPYAVMKGHGRSTKEAQHHPERSKWRASADYRDVTDADLAAFNEANP